LHIARITHLSAIYFRQRGAHLKVFSEKRLTKKSRRTRRNGNEETHLNVSDDGSWKKRGFTSLFATLIGKYTHKVLDFVIKSSFCQGCSNWFTKKNTEYDTWYQIHEENCSINHFGSADKMEVDCMKEMFSCSEELLGVKYATYIGDGDTKTFRALLDYDPYSDLIIQKKECISHRSGWAHDCARSRKKIKGLEAKAQES